MADPQVTPEEVEALIGSVVEAWGTEAVPTDRELFDFEWTSIEEGLAYEDRDAYDIVAGRRFNEVDCASLGTSFSLLNWLSLPAAVYYLGSICLCDLKNFFGPLDIEMQADYAVNMFAHLAEKHEASDLLTRAQKEAFRDYMELFVRTGRGYVTEHCAKDVLAWLS